MTLGEPDPSGGDGDERFIVPVQLVVSGGDPEGVFDPTKQPLDQIASLVKIAVEVALLGVDGTRATTPRRRRW